MVRNLSHWFLNHHTTAATAKPPMLLEMPWTVPRAAVPSPFLTRRLMYPPKRLRLVSSTVRRMNRLRMLAFPLWPLDGLQSADGHLRCA